MVLVDSAIARGREFRWGRGSKLVKLGPSRSAEVPPFTQAKKKQEKIGSADVRATASAFKEKGQVGPEVLDSMERVFPSTAYVQIEP